MEKLKTFDLTNSIKIREEMAAIDLGIFFGKRHYMVIDDQGPCLQFINLEQKLLLDSSNSSILFYNKI